MKRTHIFGKTQRGQALVEYHALIPIGILIALMAGAIGAFLTDSFQRTADGLQPETQDCEEGDPGTNENDTQGPSYATMAGHSVTLTSHVYNEATNTTSFTYRVTSSGDPSISHWVLGMPSHVLSKLVSASEAYEIGTDPNTGVAGIKFDTGYDNGGGGNNNNGGGNKGNGNKRSDAGLVLVSAPRQPRYTETRDIMIILVGNFEWEPVTVAIKAGTNTYSSTITAPVRVIEEENSCDSDGSDS